MRVFKSLGSFLKFLFRQKLKFLFVFLFVLLFLFLRFPYENLSGWLTEKVAQATKNKVHLQLNQIKFFFLPTLGLKLSGIRVHSSYSEPIKISEMRASLSLMKLFLFQLAYQLELKGFFGGNLTLKMRDGKSVPSSDRKEKIKRIKSTLWFEGVDLKNLHSFIAFPLSGKIGGESEVFWDKNLKLQPEGNLNLILENFNLSTSSIGTPFGPINLPAIDLSSSKLKMYFNEGDFFIEEFLFGSSENSISGEVNGNFQLNFVSRGLKLQTNLSDYQLKVKLEFEDSLRKEFALILDFLDQYKKDLGKGTKKVAYHFQLKGKGIKKPPVLSRL